VRLRLTPRDTSFYDQFAASARNIVDAAEVLAQIVESSSVSERGVLNQRMRDIEHANDEVTHEVMRRLNSTFVTPFDREDIYRLTAQLDDVVDYMEAAADLVLLYELEELPATTREVVAVLVKAAHATADAMPRLQGMKDLSDYWIEVNRLENEADQLYRRTVAKLFNGDYDALMAIKLKDLADQVEAAADGLEDVADTVETIALKES
jgi:predicted phosphate transport protein (TIGR00153 family)